VVGEVQLREEPWLPLLHLQGCMHVAVLTGAPPAYAGPPSPVQAEFCLKYVSFPEVSSVK